MNPTTQPKPNPIADVIAEIRETLQDRITASTDAYEVLHGAHVATPEIWFGDIGADIALILGNGDHYKIRITKGY